MIGVECGFLREAEIPLLKDVVVGSDQRFDAKAIREFAEGKNRYVFVARFEDNIIAFAYAYSLPRIDGKKPMLYLHEIEVLARYRGKGVGSQLMMFIVDFARESGFSECFVITDKGNARACRLYRRQSMKNDYEDEIVYVKEFK